MSAVKSPLIIFEELIQETNTWVIGWMVSAGYNPQDPQFFYEMVHLQRVFWFFSKSVLNGDDEKVWEAYDYYRTTFKREVNWEVAARFNNVFGNSIRNLSV